MNFLGTSLAFIASASLATTLWGGELALAELEKSCPELFSYKKFDSNVMTKMGLEEPPVAWLQKQAVSIDGVIAISLVRTGDLGLNFDFVNCSKGKFEIVVPIESNAKPDAIHSLAWSRLVYRIQFISHSKSILDDWVSFKKGEIGKEKMLDMIQLANFQTMKDMKVFFNNIWRPWAIKNGAIPIDSRAWFVFTETSDYATWLGQQKQLGSIEIWKKWTEAEQPGGPAQPATQPADKAAAEDQPSTPASKVSPR